MAGGGGNEPNLTPFIDLFSVLICFLLMTAAWTQLESFQVKIEENPKLNPDLTADNPPPEPKKKEVKLALHLKKDRVVATINESERIFPIQGQDMSSGELKSLIASWRSRYGEEQPLVIHSGDQATYGQLVRLYDLVNYLGWSKVAINPY